MPDMRESRSDRGTAVSTTSPDLSPLPAENRLWSDVKYVTVRLMLWLSIFGPMIVSAEYLYFRVVAPALDSPRIPAPFVGPDIIVVQPPTAETEPAVPSSIPDTQRRTPGKHRAPEITAPETTLATPPRRIAPADPTSVAPSPTPVPTTTPPSVPPVPSVTPTPTGSSRAAPDPVPPRTSSSTPVYDTLRTETLATNPSMETVIPE